MVEVQHDCARYIFYWRLWHYNRDDSDIVIVRSLCEPASTSLLEVGCGDGRIGFSLAPFCKTYIGIDLDDVLLDAARQRAKECNVENVRFECMNAGQLRFGDNLFDRVLFAWSLHMMADPEQAISEAFRVLKEGGQLIVIGLRSDGPYDRIISEFAECSTIDPSTHYEHPISKVFGETALRTREEKWFSYHFSSSAVAQDAFAFALSHWYKHDLSTHECQRLNSLIAELRCGDSEAITLRFPANIYIASKNISVGAVTGKSE